MVQPVHIGASVRTLAVVLLVTAGCSPVPDPPTALQFVGGHDEVHQFSLADRHVAVVLAYDGSVLVDGDAIPLPVDEETSEVVPLVLPAVTQVAIGKEHACALTASTVYCWGDQTNGALGAHRHCERETYGDTGTQCPLAPEIMPTLPPIAQLAAGDDFTCAIDDDGAVYCWGSSGEGRLGGSRVSALDDPTPVALPGPASRVELQHATACALVGDAVYCWGRGYASAPRRLELDGVIDFAIGEHHACAITTTHGLRCWGADRNGESGDLPFAYKCGTTTPHCEVGATEIPIDATRVVVGERHSCALARDGRVWCWGSNEVGQLGRDNAFLVGDAQIVLEGAVELAASYAKTCALTSDQTVWCWGAYDAPQETH